jgi:putative endonuclease
MYYVYALYSKGHNKIYIGSSSDLVARLDAHNDIRNKGWTGNFRPWNLLYSEELPSKHLALIREKQLKTAKGRAFIRSFLNN